MQIANYFNIINNTMDHVPPNLVTAFNKEKSGKYHYISLTSSESHEATRSKHDAMSRFHLSELFWMAQIFWSFPFPR